jgi:hypothetical protein
MAKKQPARRALGAIWIAILSCLAAPRVAGGEIFQLFFVSRTDSPSPDPSLSPSPSSRLELTAPSFSLEKPVERNLTIGAARPTSQPSRFLTLGTGVGVLIGSAWNSFTGDERTTFHTTAEGFFGRNTYAGGVDKSSHFVEYHALTHGLADFYERLGHSPETATWIAGGVSLASGLLVELNDGRTEFGFSWEDFALDAGGIFLAGILRRTGWRDTIGFRLGHIDQPVVPCCSARTNYGRDYSGELYTADLKIVGAARRLNRDPGPARFLLLSATYGTNGYRQVSETYRERLIGFEVGLNLAEIARALGVRETRLLGVLILDLLEAIRLPYTAIGFRYDLNHNVWYGPTAGRTVPQ